MLPTRVMVTDSALKDLRKVPDFISEKLMSWIDRVEFFGINEVRKIKGFHDEPLAGDRKGQRSIRLNRSYRAIYIQSQDQELLLVEIIEVNKHDY